MDIRGIQKQEEQDGFAKVVYGRPYRSRTCDTLIKSLVLLSLQDQSAPSCCVEHSTKPAVDHFSPGCMSNSVRNGII